MSLFEQVQSAVELAFAAAGDLVGDFWLTRSRQSGYNPATGDVTVVEVEFKFKGVLEGAEYYTEGSGDSTQRGTDVGVRKANAVLKPGEVEPEVGDVLRIGDNRHRILRVEPVAPDGTNVVLWTLVVTV